MADRYFVCHAGGDEPNDETGMIGRVYVWRGDWDRSPEDVANLERNPTMKLVLLWGNEFEVIGDTGSYTEVWFAEPPP